MSVERGAFVVVQVKFYCKKIIARIQSIDLRWSPGFCAHPWFEDVHRLSLAMEPVDLSIFAIERSREVVLVLGMEQNLRFGR